MVNRLRRRYLGNIESAISGGFMPHMLTRMVPMAAVIFGLDRISKIYVVEQLDLRRVGEMEVIPPFFNLVMAWNKGVNFGVLNFGDDGRWFLVALSLVIVAVVLIWTRRGRGWLVPFAVAAIVGGALGNICDRVTYGAVADFINMSCCGFRNPFAFNVADVAIFLGAALLILFGERRINPVTRD